MKNFRTRHRYKRRKRRRKRRLAWHVPTPVVNKPWAMKKTWAYTQNHGFTIRIRKNICDFYGSGIFYHWYSSRSHETDIRCRADSLQFTCMQKKRRKTDKRKRKMGYWMTKNFRLYLKKENAWSAVGKNAKWKERILDLENDVRCPNAQ